MYSHRSPFSFLWLGAKGENNEDNYRWIETNKLLNSSYSNWKNGSPRKLADSLDANCLSLHCTGMNWVNKPCDENLTFICEYQFKFNL